MKRHICIGLVLLVLAGCSSIGRGIAEAILDKKEETPNKECLIWSDGFTGLSADQRKTIKVMLTHGVGVKTPGHSTAFMLALTKLLDFPQMDRDYKEIKLHNNKGDSVGTLRMYRFFNDKTGKEIIFYEQTWSGITIPLKAKLYYDTTGEYSAPRADYNAVLKKYANDTLVDPMAYLGPKGGLMLDSSMQSFCYMVMYKYQDLPARSESACQIEAKDSLKSLREDDFAFVTHSLGSRLTIDTLQEIASRLKKAEKIDPQALKALHLLQSKEIPVFMMANQLPLLQIGRPLPKNVGKYEQFCKKGGKNYARRLFSRLDIVAFSDPNDLLSYAIEPNSIDSYLDSQICPAITNVSIQTTDAIDVLGTGRLANPVAAHTAYNLDPRVLEMMAHGLNKNNPPPEGCRWIQIKG